LEVIVELPGVCCFFFFSVVCLTILELEIEDGSGKKKQKKVHGQKATEKLLLITAAVLLQPKLDGVRRLLKSNQQQHGGSRYVHRPSNSAAKSRLNQKAIHVLLGLLNI
jgi:hypothetical protein